jgi:hypothetical protein
MSLTVIRALERVLIVHHQQLLHAMMVQNLLRLLQRSAHRNGDQMLFGHHLRNRQIVARFKTKIAIGKNTDQFSALGHRHARDAIPFHQLQRIRYFLVGRDGNRIDDHAAFAALHLVHFFSLALHGHVAVDDPDAALLRERNGQVRFRHRIHGRADNRNIQADAPGEASARVGVGRHHRAARRLQKYVVKSETF